MPRDPKKLLLLVLAVKMLVMEVQVRSWLRERCCEGTGVFKKSLNGGWLWKMLIDFYVWCNSKGDIQNLHPLSIDWLFFGFFATDVFFGLQLPIQDCKHLSGSSNPNQVFVFLEYVCRADATLPLSVIMCHVLYVYMHPAWYYDKKARDFCPFSGDWYGTRWGGELSLGAEGGGGAGHRACWGRCAVQSVSADDSFGKARLGPFKGVESADSSGGVL